MVERLLTSLLYYSGIPALALRVLHFRNLSKAVRQAINVLNRTISFAETCGARDRFPGGSLWLLRLVYRRRAQASRSTLGQPWRRGSKPDFCHNERLGRQPAASAHAMNRRFYAPGPQCRFIARQHRHERGTTVTMQPTGLILAMGIAAQRSHGCAAVATQGGYKSAANGWITRTLEIDEPRAA